MFMPESAAFCYTLREKWRLAVTGTLMWWNRVAGKRYRRWRARGLPVTSNK
jgi:hypothetical protein